MRELIAPLVSIVVPSFNQGQYIGRTLRSCFEQDHRPLEVLVIDGGSTDETVDLLRACREPELRWWSEPDEGVAHAVNKGLALARGEILTVQSSDDLFAPGAASAAVAAFSTEPGLGLIYGDVEHIDADSRVTGSDMQGPFDLASYVGRFQYIPQPGTFFTSTAMKAVGGWREEFSYAADADFWLRLSVRFRVRKIDRIMGRYRYHDEQRDRHRDRIARDWAGAIGDLLRSGRLDRRQQRYARMGVHLARYRYAPERDWVARTRELYAAVLSNPVAVLDPRFPGRELFPGREPIWRLFSRIKQKLGFKPRER